MKAQKECDRIEEKFAYLIDALQEAAPEKMPPRLAELFSTDFSNDLTVIVEALGGPVDSPPWEVDEKGICSKCLDESREAAYDGYGTVAGIVKSVVEVSGFETHEGAPGEGTRIYNSKFNGMLTCTVCGQVFKDGKCGCQTVAAAINAGRDNYKLSLEAAAAAIDLPEGTKFVTEAGVITVYVHKGDCGECAYEGDPNCQVECLGVRAREEG